MTIALAYYDHVYHLLNNELLSSQQHGFKKERSTALQLLNMLDNWTEALETGGQIDTNYTDYEKAFDKVPHKRLVKKIASFGLPQQTVRWMEAFWPTVRSRPMP